MNENSSTVSYRITLVGSGNLATQLGKALAEAGHSIMQVYSHTLVHAQTLASFVGGEAVAEIEQIRDGADIYIFALKDAVLQQVATQLHSHLQSLRGGVGRSAIPAPLFVHTAGSMSIDTIPSCRKGVIYPMQTFSKARDVSFADIPIFVEAVQSADLDIIRSIAQSVSNRVYEMSSDDRKYLHLSAVFCCNFVNHCYRLGELLLQGHDIPFDVMLPLIDETARKVHELSPRDAQTGPAVRWDNNVMDRHTQLLEGLADMQSIYKLLSQSIHNDQL